MMFKEGEYVAVVEADHETIRCAIIEHVKPGSGYFNIGQRQFYPEGRQLWIRPQEAAQVLKLTPERESEMSRLLVLPAIGSVWVHDDKRYVVIDHTNVGSDRPMFLPTVVYQPADPSHGTAKYSRSLVRWHARLKPEATSTPIEPGTGRCQARQYGDSMTCLRCGTAWDTNDTDPPECQATGEAAPQNAAFLRN